MATPSKKRRVISLEVKMQIIESSEKMNLTDLSKQFGLACSTVKSILDNKATILRAIDDGSKAKRSHVRQVKHGDLEEAVLQWFKQARSDNETIDGITLKVSL
jgi:hypothetical protein